ncbi:hypothetical protein FOZ62_030066 [Perkinsus olseni]|uniref:Uncharacterized protein n=1 Tax=Perkinsus olseni TaxID=32597 RepID=A0A7J6RX44_PEROL|nr:hypothetical protein FOZ62_030066 [Perkinsus olseni]
MPATHGIEMGCATDSKSKSWKWAIAVNILLIEMVNPFWADALMMDGAVDNPTQDPEVRSLRLQVVTESPPGCLPPGKGFQGENHCWYVLKGPHQYNGGALFASNNSGYTGFATLELAVILASNSSPVDVGVWADGRTIWLFNLPAGISVGVDLSIPTFLKVGGYDWLGTKRLDFPIFLRTRATVPGAGTVRAEGNGTAHAMVSSKRGLNELMAVVSAEGTAGSLSSRVMFFPFIRTNYTALDHWNYSAHITANISAGRNQNIWYV